MGLKTRGLDWMGFQIDDGYMVLVHRTLLQILHLSPAKARDPKNCSWRFVSVVVRTVPHILHLANRVPSGEAPAVELILEYMHDARIPAPVPVPVVEHSFGFHVLPCSFYPGVLHTKLD